MADNNILSALVHGGRQPDPSPGTEPAAAATSPASSAVSPIPARREVVSYMVPEPPIELAADADIPLSPGAVATSSPRERHARQREIIDKLHSGEYELVIWNYQAVSDLTSCYFLPWLWQRFRDDDLLEVFLPLFDQRRTFGTFTAAMNNAEVVKLIFVLHRPGDPIDLAQHCMGMLTLETRTFNDVKVAECGFLILRDYQHPEITNLIGRRGMQFLFNELHDYTIDGRDIELMKATTSEGNTAIQNFLGRMNWTKMEPPSRQPLLHKGTPYRTVYWEIAADTFNASTEQPITGPVMAPPDGSLDPVPESAPPEPGHDTNLNAPAEGE